MHPLKLLPLLLLAACSGKKGAPSSAKPEDVVVPTDLQSEYQITDYKPSDVVKPAPEPTPTPAPTPEKPSKKKKKMKKEEPTPVSTPATEPTGKLSGGQPIPNRRPKHDPVLVGEKITMDVTWLKTRGGEFTLEVMPFKSLNGRKVYNLRGTAKTSDFFSYIYKAEDTVESFVDFEGWFPYKFTLNGNESKVIRRYIELYDHGAGKQFVHNYNLKIKKNEVSDDQGWKPLTIFAQDAISGLHFARTLDLSSGKVHHFPMTTNGDVWDATLIVVGKEEISTKMGPLQTIKVKVETRFNGVLKQQGDAFLWFSDDEHKYPVKFEAKVKIGWIAGTATKIEPGTPGEGQ